MKRHKLLLSVTLLTAFILISVILIFNINKAKKIWTVYFCSSSSDTMYNKGQAQLIEFNDKGKVINSFNTSAYPFSALVNFNNKLLFQTKKGVSEIDNGIKELDKTINDKTVGYNMGGNLNRDIYYFLCNGTFKDGYYSSDLILGNKDDEFIYDINGFINSYGNDDSNIYLLTDSMTNKDNKQIQKISIDSSCDISIARSDLPYNIESNFKMAVTEDYIYAFVVRDTDKISILKICKDSLKLIDTIDVLDLASETTKDNYYPISTNSIFLRGNKVYYPSISGKVYSFNIDNDEFLEEFSFKDYNMNSSLNSVCCYDADEDEIYIIYLNSSDSKYYLKSYDTSGKLKDKIKVKLPNLNSRLYPHNFIKENR